MHEEINHLIFSRFVKQEIPFELISIEDLFKRCKHSEFNLYSPHRIEFHSLIIITEGKSTHTVDFNQEILSPGIMIPLTKGQVHSFNKNRDIKGFVISFDEAFITHNINEKNLFHFLHLFNNPNILIGEENLKQIIPFIHFLDRIQKDSNPNLKADLINSAFITFLLQIKRLTIYQQKTFDSQRFKDFLQFKLFISKYYKESHKAEYYANKLSVSYKYLNDICKEICNQTARAFIDNWILLEIKRNISENRYSSQEIAFKMGFNEPSNFIRFFKKFTGTTPNKYSKNN